MAYTRDDDVNHEQITAGPRGTRASVNMLHVRRTDLAHGVNRQAGKGRGPEAE
jgi:hypothetical protein